MPFKKNMQALLVLVVFLLFFSGCAPKKIHLYNDAGGLRALIAESALLLQGKPYKAAAKGPDTFDCSGLVYYVFKRHRIILPVTAEEQARSGTDVPYGDIRAADLVLFKIKSDYHIGIIISRDEFVHASKSRGVVVDKIAAPYWQKHLVGFKTVF